TLGLLAVVAILAVRLWLLTQSEADLFVDESQYWLWGQELAFGYYSKPPLIGWVIRASTELGEISAFWVRAPAIVFHGISAVILMLAARQFTNATAAVLTGLAYLTVPGVVVGSLLISTDTILMPFYAVALALYIRLLDHPSRTTAIFMGVALGLAFMAKYAAIYFLISAFLVHVFHPTLRLRVAEAALALVACLITVSPNLVWNVMNDLSTWEHTLDNVDWVRPSDEPRLLNLFDRNGMIEFFLTQFAVFGPILFFVYLSLFWDSLRRGTPTAKLLVWFSAAPILMICLQALLSRAYGNWAAPAYVAASLLVVPWLLENRPRLLLASFVVNGIIAVGLPLATTQARTLQFEEDRLVFERYVGRADMSAYIGLTARQNNLTAIVSDNRDLLADLFYRKEQLDMEIYAIPPRNRAQNHYALKFPRPTPFPDEYLFVARQGRVPPCDAVIRELGRITPERGAYRGDTFVLSRVPAGC
ncbi:MAG: glycosyltransferase family 39 protein, partial [Pseudomonadota bacterium]